MALPSSPPLLPEQDLPTAPSLLTLASASIPGISALNRKRQLSDYGSLSSDPLFSDATTDEDASQYEEQPRRKRLVRGPWWSLGRKNGQSLRRKMAKKEGFRNADSGVWMGSDESEESSGSLVSSQQRMQELAMGDAEEEEELKTDETVPDAEALAARFVHDCVDAGKESVDLSDLGLNNLSDATLRLLHQLIRSSFTDFTHPPSEDEFSPLTPSIQLFLSRNRLHTLPCELFSLTNISVLSLRNNELIRLPPAIARLEKLKELNIAGNSIRYLPWELLDLLYCRGKHRQITVRPNPLIEPCDLSGPSPLPKANFTRAMPSEEPSLWADTRDTVDNLRRKYVAEGGDLTIRGELELRLKLGRMLRIQYLQEASRAGRELKLCREELIYLASSAVRYFGVDGTPVRHPSGFQQSGEDYAAVLDPTANAPSTSGSSSAPSLFELTLRSLQTNFNLQDFLPQMAAFGIASSLATAINRAATNTQQHGNETCSTCGKHYIIARAEWMEYWFYGFSSQTELTPETVSPFLRKACSWGCARPCEVGEFRC